MSLKLVTTEKFNDLECNFYRNTNDEILLTREQIGTALEYSNPIIAISKIHNKHKNRLDEFSVVTKLVSTDGKQYDMHLYTTKGVMELCRWSRQSKANQFMDFVWDVMDKLLHNEPVGNTANNDLLNQMLIQNQVMVNSMIQTQNTMISMLSTITAQLPKPFVPPYTKWIREMYIKVDKLAEYNNLTRKTMLNQLFIELEESYDIDLKEYETQYRLEYNTDKAYTINIIGADIELKKLFTILVDTQIEQAIIMSN